jgi:hypothetical protein
MEGDSVTGLATFLRQSKLTYESAVEGCGTLDERGSSLPARKHFPTLSLLVREHAASTERLQAQTVEDISARRPTISSRFRRCPRRCPYPVYGSQPSYCSLLSYQDAALAQPCDGTVDQLSGFHSQRPASRSTIASGGCRRPRSNSEGKVRPHLEQDRNLS